MAEPEWCQRRSPSPRRWDRAGECFRRVWWGTGLFAGTKRKINFLEIDRNDFDLLGAHVQTTWRREPWLAAAAVRGASLRNRGNARVFYQEVSVERQFFRQWRAG